MNNSYWPKFLTSRAYELADHYDYLRRAQWSYPYIVKEEADRRIMLNENTPYAAPLDIDTALFMFERMAAEYLL